MEEEVVPVVEELRRRLPVKVSVTGQGQGEEESCAQDGGEENGNFSFVCISGADFYFILLCVITRIIYWIVSTSRVFICVVEFPFEFRALEVVLEATCSFLDARTRELETNVYPALDELTSKVIKIYFAS